MPLAHLRSILCHSKRPGRTSNSDRSRWTECVNATPLRLPHLSLANAFGFRPIPTSFSTSPAIYAVSSQSYLSSVTSLPSANHVITYCALHRAPYRIRQYCCNRSTQCYSPSRHCALSCSSRSEMASIGPRVPQYSRLRVKYLALAPCPQVAKQHLSFLVACIMPCRRSGWVGSAYPLCLRTGARNQTMCWECALADLASLCCHANKLT